MAAAARSALAPRRSPWRWALAGAALAAAAGHVPVIGPHLEEAPYLVVLFVLLTWAYLFLAAASVSRDDDVVYGLAIVTGGLAIAGYAATRLVAFPQLDHDVGRWLDPFGLVCVSAEAAMVIAAVKGLRQPATPRHERAASIDRPGGQLCTGPPPSRALVPSPLRLDAGWGTRSRAG